MTTWGLVSPFSQPCPCFPHSLFFLSGTNLPGGRLYFWFAFWPMVAFCLLFPLLFDDFSWLSWVPLLLVLLLLFFHLHPILCFLLYPWHSSYCCYSHHYYVCCLCISDPLLCHLYFTSCLSSSMLFLHCNIFFPAYVSAYILSIPSISFCFCHSFSHLPEPIRLLYSGIQLMSSLSFFPFSHSLCGCFMILCISSALLVLFRPWSSSDSLTPG